MAAGATLEDPLAGTVAPGTLSDRDQLGVTAVLDPADLTAPVAFGTRLDRGPILGSRPPAVGAGVRPRHVHEGLCPVDRRGEGQPDRDLDVAPARGHRTAPAAVRAPEASAEVPEQLLEERVGGEEVLEVSLVGEVLPAEPTGTEVRLDGIEPLGVVPGAGLGVGEDLVRLRDLLEPLLGDLRVLLGDIRVVLAGEPPVGALDLVRGSGLRYPEDLVVVFLRHGGDASRPEITGGGAAGSARYLPSQSPRRQRGSTGTGAACRCAPGSGRRRSPRRPRPQRYRSSSRAYPRRPEPIAS